MIRTFFLDLFHRLRRWRRREWLIASGISVLSITLILWFFSGRTSVAVVGVQKGEFMMDIRTRGETDAVRSMNVSVPDLRRRMTLQIVGLAPEGSTVEAGDFLFQLDVGEAKQNMESAQNEMENARAQLESEKAGIASNKAQMQSDLETQKLSLEQAQLSLKTMQFEPEARKQDMAINLKKAELALGQAGKKMESQEIIDRATLLKAELKVGQARAKLKEATDALAKLTITAPIRGLVVYREIWSSGQMKKVQVGDSPWPGMPVIQIPDLAEMKAKITIGETDINQVRTGQDALVTVDALEGKSFPGVVTLVASLARRDMATNVKLFDAEVRIDSSDGRIRPGMTCDCRIVTGRIPNAMFVPIQSVFQKDGRTVVYAARARGFSKREVRTGPKNSLFIVIERGLDEGDRIALRDPTVPLDDSGQDEIQGKSSMEQSRSDDSGQGFGPPGPPPHGVH
jgi:HlyD family secretion protein